MLVQDQVAERLQFKRRRHSDAVPWSTLLACISRIGTAGRDRNFCGRRRNCSRRLNRFDGIRRWLSLRRTFARGSARRFVAGLDEGTGRRLVLAGGELLCRFRCFRRRFDGKGGRLGESLLRVVRFRTGVPGGFSRQLGFLPGLLEFQFRLVRFARRPWLSSRRVQLRFVSS